MKNKLETFFLILICAASLSSVLFLNLEAKEISESLSLVSNQEFDNERNNNTVLPDVEILVTVAHKIKEVLSLMPTK